MILFNVCSILQYSTSVEPFAEQRAIRSRQVADRPAKTIQSQIHCCFVSSMVFHSSLHPGSLFPHLRISPNRFIVTLSLIVILISTLILSLLLIPTPNLFSCTSCRSLRRNRTLWISLCFLDARLDLAGRYIRQAFLARPRKSSHRSAMLTPVHKALDQFRCIFEAIEARSPVLGVIKRILPGVVEKSDVVIVVRLLMEWTSSPPPYEAL